HGRESGESLSRPRWQGDQARSVLGPRPGPRRPRPRGAGVAEESTTSDLGELTRRLADWLSGGDAEARVRFTATGPWAAWPTLGSYLSGPPSASPQQRRGLACAASHSLPRCSAVWSLSMK